MLGVYVICLCVQGHQHWFRYSLVGQELWIAFIIVTQHWLRYSLVGQDLLIAFTSVALSHWTGIITVELQLILFAH